MAASGVAVEPKTLPVMLLGLESLQPSPLNPRKHFDPIKLEELAATMRDGKGVIEPLVARVIKGGKHEIVAGERRWRAAALAGVTDVPVWVKALTDVEVLELMVIENDAREDLNPMEEAAGFKSLMTFGFDADKLARRIGHTKRYVTDRVKLLGLIPAAQALLASGEITGSHGALLARLTPAQQKTAINPQEQALFDQEPDRGLLRPDSGDVPPTYRVVTAKEFENWINRNCRLDPKSEQVAELFPETAEELGRAETVVQVTFERYVSVQPKNGPKLHCYEVDWQRADGRQKSKTCPKAVTGVVVLGAGRGDALKVCVDRACPVHWPKVKAAPAATAKVSPSEQKWRAQKQREQSRRRQFKAALPRIIDACVTKLTTTKPLALVELIANGIRGDHFKAARKRMAIANSDDALRAFALAELLSVANDYNGETRLPKLAKSFGLNLAPLLKAPKVAKVKAAKKPAAKASKKKR